MYIHLKKVYIFKSAQQSQRGTCEFLNHTMVEW